MNNSDPKILITGAGGQLGESLKVVLKEKGYKKLLFTDIDDLNIVDFDDVMAFISKEIPDYIVNAAAYTAVDKAEDEPVKAYDVNAVGPANLARAGSKVNALLFQISTEYVYHSDNSGFLSEDNELRPKGVYARTKYHGERFVKKYNQRHFIIRTSWLYSEYGNNFVKTMIRLASEGKSLKVVNDQYGTPTYADDLARAIEKMIRVSCRTDSEQSPVYGVYNYSNLGETNWHQFAESIFRLAGIDADLSPIGTVDYPTKADRPENSRLDKSKIIRNFKLEIPQWEESLKTCLFNLGYG